MNVVKNCRYGSIIYNANDTWIGRSLTEYAEYSQGEVDLFQKIIQPGQTVLEVGANIGVHTVVLSRYVGEKGTVVAFEPQRLCYYTLCANIALNNLTNVVCLNQAVGSKEGKIDVPELDYKKPNNFGGLELDRQYDNTIPKQSVKLITIDSLKLKQLDFIKVDVEGMEADVLLGAKEKIKEWEPILYVENDREEKSAPLVKLVRSLGYQIYFHAVSLFNTNNYLQNPTNVFGHVVSVNMLCVPGDLPFDPDEFGLIPLPIDKQIVLRPQSIQNIQTIDEVKLEATNALAKLAVIYSNNLFDHDTAKTYLKTAMSIQPNTTVDNNMIAILCKEVRYQEALQYAKEDSSNALYNKGIILGGMGKWQEAIECYRKIIANDPNYVAAHFNLALCLLLLGQTEEGWKEYEWRFKMAKIKQVLSLLPDVPMWDGSDLTGKKLLLFNEQGAGDGIMCMRYVPSLKGDITWACSRSFIRLAQQCVPSCQFQEFNADDGNYLSGNWDYKCSMMDLPMRLSDPGCPYIHVDSDVNFNDYCLNVGIAWAGNEGHENDSHRSCFLKQFDVLNLPHVRLINLQKGGEERTWPDKGKINLRDGSNLTLVDLPFDNFYELAKIIAPLDLVISVDTSVAHLAGAMGKETWLLCGTYSDFRWGFGDKTHWYPNMRIFRLKKDWDELFQEIRKELLRKA